MGLKVRQRVAGEAIDGWMADGIGNEQWNNTLCIHLMAFETADKFELKALRIEGGPFEIGQSEFNVSKRCAHFLSRTRLVLSFHPHLSDINRRHHL